MINNFGHIEKSGPPSDQLIVKINVDLMRILTITDYFSIKDISAKLGGYKALIDPLIGMFIPFFSILSP